MCVNMLTYMPVYFLWEVSRDARRGLIPRTEVTDSSEPPSGYRDLNPSPLGKQSALSKH